jgi:hypothetical protein
MTYVTAMYQLRRIALSQKRILFAPQYFLAVKPSIAVSEMPVQVGLGGQARLLSENICLDEEGLGSMG